MDSAADALEGGGDVVLEAQAIVVAEEDVLTVVAP
jgi:hypothetical protein